MQVRNYYCVCKNYEKVLATDVCIYPMQCTPREKTTVRVRKKKETPLNSCITKTQIHVGLKKKKRKEKWFYQFGEELGVEKNPKYNKKKYFLSYMHIEHRR